MFMASGSLYDSRVCALMACVLGVSFCLNSVTTYDEKHGFVDQCACLSVCYISKFAILC